MCCPAEVAEIRDSDDGVTATLADGTRLRAKVLVAAEGAESSVRAKLGIAFEGHDYSQRAVVAHGAEQPRVPNDNEVGRSQNRRVEIVLLSR